MPYIIEEQRPQVHQRGYALNGAELSYLISYHINRFLKERQAENARAGEDRLRYADYAEALAAVTGSDGEFRRLHLEPYEDKKRDENGDV